MIELNQVERALQKNFKRYLWSPFIHALKDFNLVQEGDKIAVAISGGKDSLVLSKLFQELKRVSQVNFELCFICMNPGFSEYNLNMLKENLKNLNIPCQIYSENIFRIAQKMSPKKPCYMCAKMRRGSLYAKATELGCNKLALGHHMDDVIETTVMSMFYMGKIETMLPKLHSDNFDIELIRPLFYVEEKDIKRFVKYIGLTPMSCGCEVASGLFDSKRRDTKELLNQLVLKDKDIKKRIMQSVFNVNIEKILGYKYRKEKFSIYDDIIIKKWR